MLRSFKRKRQDLPPVNGIKIVDGGSLIGQTTFTAASIRYAFVGTTYTAFAIDVPRFGSETIDGLNPGLIIEGARTNSIRNSTMVGVTNGVIGSGGVAPTNWTMTTNDALTATVVGTGTANGLSYVDLRWSGTTSGAGGNSASFETTTGITTTNATVWTSSFFYAVVGGSTANLGVLVQSIVERTSAGVTVQTDTGADFKASATSSLQRSSYTATLSGGGTVARINNRIEFNYGSGVAIDITIRIAAPQLELGAFASSFIPTTTVAVTRAADVCHITSLATKPWFNSAQGTIVCQFRTTGTPQSFRRPFQIGDNGDAANCVAVWEQPSAPTVRVAVIDNSVTQASFDPGTTTWAINTLIKVAVGYQVNNIAASCNGSAVTSDTSCTIPSSQMTQFDIGMNGGNGGVLNGTIISLTYYPTRLPNATLVSLAT